MQVEQADDAYDLVTLTRLNHEPIVLLGLNRSEIVMLLCVSTLVWLPLMQVVWIIMGKWMMGLPVGLMFITATVVVAGAILRKVKTNRPEGYYQQVIRLRMEDFHLLSTHLIRRAGPWDTRRHKKTTRRINLWGLKIK